MGVFLAIVERSGKIKLKFTTGVASREGLSCLTAGSAMSLRLFQYRFRGQAVELRSHLIFYYRHFFFEEVERVRRFERPTSTLARSRSTPELHPQSSYNDQTNWLVNQ